MNQVKNDDNNWRDTLRSRVDPQNQNDMMTTAVCCLEIFISTKCVCSTKKVMLFVWARRLLAVQDPVEVVSTLRSLTGRTGTVRTYDSP